MAHNKRMGIRAGKLLGLRSSDERKTGEIVSCSERAEGARDAALHEPHVVHRAFLVGFTAAHGDEDPVAVRRNRRHRTQRSALTSLRRIPAMNSNPATAASIRPRSRATWSDSPPRPRRRGRWQVARLHRGSSAAYPAGP